MKKDKHLKSENAQAILEIIRKKKRITFREICQITGLTDADAFTVLRLLASQGVIFWHEGFWMNGLEQTQTRQPSLEPPKQVKPTLTVISVSRREEPHFAICLNCRWFEICPDKKSAEGQAELHNIRHHYGSFHWETYPFSGLGFPSECYDEWEKTLKAMNRKQRHEWRVMTKERLHRIVRASESRVLSSANSLSKEEAIGEIFNALESQGFSTPQLFENYVFATKHCENARPLRLFILVQEKESAMAREYAEPRLSIVFHVGRFRQRLRSVIKWLFSPKKRPIGPLDTNVLTSFGWHANQDADSRQDSLLAAASELHVTHISKLLLMLKDFWRKNPKMPEEDYFNVSQDYDWFCSNVGENRIYFRLKQKLISILQNECRRLAEERKIQLSGDKEVIERFYLITY